MIAIIANNITIISSAVLTLIGSIGNTMSIFIMTKPKLLKDPFFRYMISATIFDNFSIFFLWISPSFPSLGLNTVSLNCKMNIYFGFLVSHYGAWMNVLCSLDRYLSVKHPTKCKFRKKFKYQFLAILLVCLLVGLIDTPLAFYVDVSKNQSSTNGCSARSNGVYLAGLGALMETILPCLIMAVFTTMIGYELIILKKKTTNKKHFTKEKKMLKTLSSVNIFFFITTSPYTLYMFILGVLNEEFYGTLNFTILRNIYRIYPTFGFFVLFASNTLFRNHFFSFFVCTKNLGLKF